MGENCYALKKLLKLILLLYYLEWNLTLLTVFKCWNSIHFSFYITPLFIISLIIFFQKKSSFQYLKLIAYKIKLIIVASQLIMRLPNVNFCQSYSCASTLLFIIDDIIAATANIAITTGVNLVQIGTVSWKLYVNYNLV